MFTYSLKKLEIWIEAKKLAKYIYLITKNFPIEENFGLISQLRSASISVCSNIAEVSTRKTNKDKACWFWSVSPSIRSLKLCHALNSSNPD